jgi:hypothetical protein
MLFVPKTLTCWQYLFAVEFNVTVISDFNFNKKKVVCIRHRFTGEKMSTKYSFRISESKKNSTAGNRILHLFSVNLTLS